jgi:hypothetical protein
MVAAAPVTAMTAPAVFAAAPEIAAAAPVLGEAPVLVFAAPAGILGPHFLNFAAHAEMVAAHAAYFAAGEEGSPQDRREPVVHLLHQQQVESPAGADADEVLVLGEGLFDAHGRSRTPRPALPLQGAPRSGAAIRGIRARWSGLGARGGSGVKRHPTAPAASRTPAPPAPLTPLHPGRCWCSPNPRSRCRCG